MTPKPRTVPHDTPLNQKGLPASFSMKLKASKALFTTTSRWPCFLRICRSQSILHHGDSFRMLTSISNAVFWPKLYRSLELVSSRHKWKSWSSCGWPRSNSPEWYNHRLFLMAALYIGHRPGQALKAPNEGAKAKLSEFETEFPFCLRLGDQSASLFQ